MQPNAEIILKDDGFPVTALMNGAVARIIQPQGSGAWVCLQVHTHAHESQEVQDRLSEFLPPEVFQLAIDPVSAHRLGEYLIEKAKQAVAPDGTS